MQEVNVSNQVMAFIQEHSWLLFTGVLLFLFKSTISKIAEGILIFFGNEYNEDDVVYLDGHPARIARVGIWKTVFYVYEIKDTIVVGGRVLAVQNDRLKTMKIEKPLQLIDLREGKEK